MPEESIGNEALKDFYLVSSFCMGNYGQGPVLYQSLSNVMADCLALKRRDFGSYAAVKLETGLLMGVVKSFHEDIQKSLDELSTEGLTDTQRDMVDFELSGRMYRRAARAVGPETAEEFLRFYFFNSGHFTPEERDNRLRHLCYNYRGRPFVDFRHDKKAGRISPIKVRKTGIDYIPERPYS